MPPTPSRTPSTSQTTGHASRAGFVLLALTRRTLAVARRAELLCQMNIVSLVCRNSKPYPRYRHEAAERAGSWSKGDASGLRPPTQPEAHPHLALQKTLSSPAVVARCSAAPVACRLAFDLRPPKAVSLICRTSSRPPQALCRRQF
ncbi:hypothetical protein C8Q80DRAFT_938787 [Daedaleopsis nitida]|nr:hypothetical protein C8Q80DRAFT_938787 [Daedaleopsis nitida]